MKVIALIAALIHFYFFLLESVLWTRPKTRKLFRMSEQQAEMTRSLALNQGFYNLFLTGAVIVGLVMGEAGVLLIDYALLSMLLAGLVLVISNKKMFRGAIIQAGLPILYFVMRLIQLTGTNGQ